MNTLNSNYAALADLSVGHIYGLIGLVGGLLVALTLPAIAMYYHHRRQQMWHETARIALEKGQPMPPQPPSDEELEHAPPTGVNYTEWQQAKRAEERRHDIKGGLVLIAVGAGLYLMMGSGSVGRFMGAIPGLIGVRCCSMPSLEPVMHFSTKFQRRVASGFQENRRFYRSANFLPSESALKVHDRL